MKKLDRKSHNKAIAKHLESGFSLTSSEAFRLYGTMSLPQRIYDLRNEPFNMNIDSNVTHEDGVPKANYRLRDVKQEEKPTGYWKKFWKEKYEAIRLW